MIAKKPKILFGIRAKLYTLTLVSFAIIIGVTVWRVGEGASKTARQAVDRSLLQSSVILKTKMDSRFASIQETTYSLARDGRVLPFVFDSDSATLQDLSLEFKAALDFDTLIITDRSGEILARSDRPEAIGLNLSGRSQLFDAALQGQAAHGIFASQGKLLQIVAVPIFDNVAKDLVRGSIALAYALSPEIAMEINKLTASDIGFYVFERGNGGVVTGVKRTYSTASTGLSRSLEEYFETVKTDWVNFATNSRHILINIGDEEYYAQILPLEKFGGGALGFVIALRSQTELLKPFNAIQRQVVLVGLLGLLAATILAGLIAHGISRPLIQLVSVTETIEQGTLPDKKVYPRSNDETGVLYDALFRMGKSIQEKSELENYLAQLAQEIDTADEIITQDSSETASLLTDIEAKTSSSSDETERFNDTGLPRSVGAKAKKPDEDATTIINKNVSAKNSEGQGENQAGELLQPHTLIDSRYEILNLLGVGAMGQVYLAEDRDLNEKLAFKILNQKKFDASFVQYFKEEIRLARRVTHRNILRTFDFGIWQGFYYITMEFVQGHELDTIIKSKGALDINIGCMMARQICSALVAAHEQGIIHRDLKPANMMVSKQGILKIMDFGLAMQIERRKDGRESSTSNKVNVVAGTPKYMAPEQFLAGELDERTDIYAVGAILYTIFTSEPPFKAKNITEFRSKHLHQSPPLLRSRVPDAPEKLEAIIVKAMAKKKEDRYSSVRELLEDLRTL